MSESQPEIVPGIPMFISPAQMGAVEAKRGHFDPYVADLVIKANRVIRSGIDHKPDSSEFRSIINKLLKYDNIGIVERWFAVRRMVKAVRQGATEGHYTALVAWSHPGYGPDARCYYCSLMLVALPEPFQVHGMPLFPARNSTVKNHD